MAAEMIARVMRLFDGFLRISLSYTAVIIIMLIFVPLTDKRWRVSWRYVVFAVLAVRLLIPLWFEFPVTPIQIPMPQNIVRNAGITPGLMQGQPSPAEAAGNIAAGYRITPHQAAAAVWAAVAAGVFLWNIMSYWIFSARLAQKRFPLGIDCRCRVYESEYIKSPLLIGYFKPVIYLPRGVYTDAECGKVIAHELVHLKRGDLWIKLLFMLVLSVHWFNPAVHIMVRRALKDMEYSCDYSALKGKDRQFVREYADTILKTITRKGY